MNDFFTSLKGQPRDQIRAQVQTYLDANPGVRDELQAIRQPSVDFRERCGAPANPLTVSAARFVAQGRSVVGASVDGIACAPTDLVGLKVSALLGGGTLSPWLGRGAERRGLGRLATQLRAQNRGLIMSHGRLSRKRSVIARTVRK